MKIHISQPSNEILWSSARIGRSRVVFKKQYFHSISKVTMMYSFVCLIFLSALIFVQCQEFQHEEKGPHKFQENSKCSAKKNQIRHNRMKAATKPREKLVTLIPEHGYEYFPSKVTAMRCDSGVCGSRLTPMPTEMKPIRKMVHLLQEGKPMKCVSVEVDEHLACDCMCMQSKEKCKPSEEWIESSCRCQCKDRKTKASQCKVQYGMEWYEDDCSCACTEKIMECRTGEKWNKEVCRCMPK